MACATFLSRAHRHRRIRCRRRVLRGAAGALRAEGQLPRARRPPEGDPRAGPDDLEPARGLHRQGGGARRPGAHRPGRSRPARDEDLRQRNRAAPADAADGTVDRRDDAAERRRQRRRGRGHRRRRPRPGRADLHRHRALAAGARRADRHAPAHRVWRSVRGSVARLGPGAAHRRRPAESRHPSRAGERRPRAALGEVRLPRAVRRLHRRGAPADRAAVGRPGDPRAVPRRRA